MQVEWAFSFAGSPWTEDLWSGGAGSSWEDKLHLGHQGARAWERPCERNRWVFRGPARKIALGLVGGPGREHSGMRATVRLLGGCRIEGGDTDGTPLVDLGGEGRGHSGAAEDRQGKWTSLEGSLLTGGIYLSTSFRKKNTCGCFFFFFKSLLP